MNLNRSFKAVILDMIKASNPTAASLTEVDIALGSSSVNTGGLYPKNSKVTVSAAEGSTAYEGQVDVFYNRLDLDAVVAANTAVFNLEVTEDSSQADIAAAFAAAFKARYGINCATEDFTVAPDLWDAGVLQVKAAVNSSWFYSSAVVELAFASADPEPDDPSNLPDIIEDPDLDGLDYPDDED